MKVELVVDDNEVWWLTSLTDPLVRYGPFPRLIDALYERERLNSGTTPPFGKWVIYGVEEVEPLCFDGESDEDMRAAHTTSKTLHLRDWEYEALLEILDPDTPESYG